MRFQLFAVTLLPLVLFVGCSSEETSNVVAGAEQSEIDKYNALIADSDKAIMDDEAAAKK